jgi:5-methylcytosine-specific restriction endonuclease McrA
VLRRDKYRCHWCGGRAREADHLLSVSEGGQPYDPGNIVASCKPCNSSRGGELAKARQLGSTLGSRRRAEPYVRAEVREGAIRL